MLGGSTRLSWATITATLAPGTTVLSVAIVNSRVVSGTLSEKECWLADFRPSVNLAVRSVNASWLLYRVRRLRLVVGRVVVLGILESVMCSVIAIDCGRGAGSRCAQKKLELGGVNTRT